MEEDQKDNRSWFYDFPDSMKIKTRQSESLSCREKDELWRRIEAVNRNSIAKKKSRYRVLFLFCGGAVAAVLIVLTLTLNLDRQEKTIDRQYVSAGIESVRAPDTKVTDIQLVISEEKTVLLKGNDMEVTYDSSEIVLTDKKDDLKKEKLNIGETVGFSQLIVPSGKRSILNLADGSRIWVNAGTRVVYPPAFDGEKREIYVDGEIYADIVRKGKCPFIVRTKNMKVEVMGTSFNVTAYENDGEQHVVLKSGSVKVRMERGEAILTPGQMFLCDNHTFQVKNVDVNEYISWKDGIYQYDSESLDLILKRLSRYYGQEISCSPQAGFLKCSGKLDLKDDLVRVLNGIARTAPISYKYEDGKYRITNKK